MKKYSGHLSKPMSRGARVRKSLKSKSRRRMTSEQRAWCDNYKWETGFEALMDDFREGSQTFEHAARKSVRWFEDWSTDAHLNIGRNIPGDDV